MRLAVTYVRRRHESQSLRWAISRVIQTLLNGSSFTAMKIRLLIASTLLVAAAPVHAQLNPYQIGMQYCQMVNSGISRDKAWNYIVENIAETSVNNSYGQGGDPYAPWSPRRTLGGSLGYGIGTGLAQGMKVGLQLRSMKPDIERVIAANCPVSNQGDDVNVAEDNWNPERLQRLPSSGPLDKGVIGIGIVCGYPKSELEAAKKKGLTADQINSNLLSNDCRIANIMPGSPAHSDGRLRVGDRIVEVNGEKISRVTTKGIAGMISGEPGTSATLVIDNRGQLVAVTLKRVLYSDLQKQGY